MCFDQRFHTPMKHQKNAFNSKVHNTINYSILTPVSMRNEINNEWTKFNFYIDLTWLHSWIVVMSFHEEIFGISVCTERKSGVRWEVEGLQTYNYDLIQINRKQVISKLTNSFFSFKICIRIIQLLSERLLVFCKHLSVNWFQKLLRLENIKKIYNNLN